MTFEQYDSRLEYVVKFIIAATQTASHIAPGL